MSDVEFAHISKSFSRALPASGPAGADSRAIVALDDVSLQIPAGQSFVLLGPSGCGKTTLLRILAGLEMPDCGKVCVGGRDVTYLPPEKRPTAMVFQNYALFPHLTVAENIAFGLRLRKHSTGAIKAKVKAMLELVRLNDFGDRRIHALSGGQQQRVALARVLAVEPQVLLLDEPLSNLDAELRHSTRTAIRQIQAELGITMVYITHDQEEGFALADQLALMQRGRILQSGSVAELFSAPKTVEAARFLGRRNILAVRVLSAAPPFFVLAEGDLDSSGANRLEIRCSPESAAMARNLGNGSLAWLAILPSELRVLPVEATLEIDAAGCLGEIALVCHLGTHVELEVTLKSSKQSVRVVDGASPGRSGSICWKRGQSVRVSARDESGLLYGRSAEFRFSSAGV